MGQRDVKVLSSDNLPVPMKQLGGGQPSGKCEFIISEIRQQFPYTEWRLSPLHRGGS